ncbi:MAG: transcription antitermination factor NusB [Lachnospiraceae bacterium]|nr:transcription antitermination factor NusB [Lachnospiraceae bacterium]
MTRRQLRESIFHVLFRVEFNSKEEWNEQLELYMDELDHPAGRSVITAEDDETAGKTASTDTGEAETTPKERNISQIFEEADMQVTLVTDLDLAYIRQKVEQIHEKLPEIDEKIAENTEGWALNRIGKTELAILRLSVYELLYDEDVPEKVAINEAVELAKIYCPEEAKGFVNAVLAKFTRS